MKTLRYQSPLIVCILLILILLKLPTGFEGAVTYQEAERCVATVTSVDNSSIVDTGLVRSGEQRCVLKIEDGKFKDQTVTGVNMLRGSLEQDKLFSEGDRALVVVSYQGETVSNVTMIEHYRIPGELVMAGMFVLFLIFFAGRNGVRAVFSFILTIVAIWKLLTPMYLKGESHLGGTCSSHAADDHYYCYGLRIRPAVCICRQRSIFGNFGDMCIGDIIYGYV